MNQRNKKENISIINPDILRRGIIGLILMIIISFLSYTGFLISTTVKITQNRADSKTAQQLQSDIADLEGEFLSKSQNLTLEYATELGFVTVESPYFASLNNEEKLALLFNGHE